jgi:protein O-mannosyl-transferase
MEMEITVKRTRSAPTRLQKSPISAPASREPGLLSRPGFFIPVALCLVAAVFAVYAPTLNFQFIVDDHFFTSDPRVQTSGHVWEYFTDYVWAEYDGGPATFYRPLFILWTRWNFILCGLSPWGWHLLSIAKHVVVAVLLGVLAWKLLRDRFAALIAATLFALHPAQVESVAWVTVPDPLMSAGVLCTLLLYFRYVKGLPESQVREGKSRKGTRITKAIQPSGLWLIASAVVCLVTLFAKETAILLPVVIFLLALFRPRGEPAAMGPARSESADFGSRLARALHQIIPFACVTVLYLLMRFHALGGKLSSQTQHLALSTEFVSWPGILWFYVKVLFWPVRSHAFADPIVLEGFTVRGVLLPGLGVMCATAALAGALFWAWRKAGRVVPPEEAVGVQYALLVGALLLVLPILLALDLNALSPGNFLHGRYTYLPLVGLSLLVAAAWHLAGNYRMPLLCAAGLLGVVFAALTVSQEQQWSDDMTVLTVAHQIAPHNPPVAQAFADARVHMAEQLDADGRYSEALPVLEQVTVEYPRDWYAWATLADCFYHLDNLTEAEKSLHRAAELSHKSEVIQQWQALRAEMGLPSFVLPE